MRLGSDPEVFLINPVGKHIAINGIINAGKNNPMQIKDMPKGFTLQEDNVALEYGIPPAATAEEFDKYIQQVMDKSRTFLPEGLDFSKLSCTVFEDDQLMHPMSRKFGCEPDYCAYTLEPNPSPMPPCEGMRSAGGHIHVETEDCPYEVAKSMDFHLGIPSVLMDDGVERKQLYGKAGAFRYKPYGVEYRTLSNFWVFSPELRKWAWNATTRALEMGPVEQGLSDYVREVINTNNKNAAQSLVKEYGLEMV